MTAIYEFSSYFNHSLSPINLFGFSVSPRQDGQKWAAILRISHISNLDFCECSKHLNDIVIFGITLFYIIWQLEKGRIMSGATVQSSNSSLKETSFLMSKCGASHLLRFVSQQSRLAQQQTRRSPSWIVMDFGYLMTEMLLLYTTGVAPKSFEFLNWESFLKEVKIKAQ